MRKMSLRSKRTLNGYLFVLPFVVGFVFLFMSPLLLYFNLSLSEISPGNGYINIDFIGLKNYIAVFKDVEYIKNSFKSIANLVMFAPAVLLFSFFIANLLNGNFLGRTLSRAVFFLPVIVASGLLKMLSTDVLVTASLNSLNDSNSSKNLIDLAQIVYKLFGENEISIQLLRYASEIVKHIYEITMSSGVQIIVFLAGLQSIPNNLYEASSIEGCSNWENLWKITLPIMSPIILVNAVYTVIDSLNGLSNPIVLQLFDVSMKKHNYDISAAMGTVYFAFSLIIISIIIGVANRFVFYENK